MPEIKIDSTAYTSLRRHLFMGEVEQAAFAIARQRGNNNTALMIEDLYLVPDKEFAIQTPYHIELVNKVQEKMIKIALLNDASLIEFHSHRSKRLACFSRTDVLGLKEFAPHVIWRTKQRPYVSVVFHETSFDALLWNTMVDKPVQLQTINVTGRRPIIATGLTLKQNVYGKSI